MHFTFCVCICKKKIFFLKKDNILVGKVGNVTKIFLNHFIDMILYTNGPKSDTLSNRSIKHCQYTSDHTTVLCIYLFLSTGFMKQLVKCFHSICASIFTVITNTFLSDFPQFVKI